MASFLVFTVNTLNAVEAWSSVELKSHYFLSRVILLRLMFNVKMESEQKVTYTKRAARIRGAGLYKVVSSTGEYLKVIDRLNMPIHATWFIIHSYVNIAPMIRILTARA